MTEPREDSPHTIDAIVAALQSPARAEELEGEEALVGAMAAAVVAIDHEEPVSMTFLPRPLKLGLIAGVAVLSVAGVAAAATGALPERRPDRPVATTVLETTSTSPEVTAAAVTAADPTTVLSPSTSPTEAATTTPAGSPGIAELAQGLGALPGSAPPCPDDVENHGQYVSDVAQGTPPGPGHGEVVSAAAQSDCGKDVATTDSDEPDPAAMAAHRADTDPAKPGKGGSNGQDGEGQGQGQGQGQGAGNSDGKSSSNAGGNGAAHGGGSPPAPHPRGGNG